MHVTSAFPKDAGTGCMAASLTTPLKKHSSVALQYRVVAKYTILSRLPVCRLFGLHEQLQRATTGIFYDDFCAIYVTQDTHKGRNLEAGMGGGSERHPRE